MTQNDDHIFMQAALTMARRGLGRTWPNPSVGCVIVKDGMIIARAVTADGGRPHAETQALTQAGRAARGATAYVTFEPCCHEGKTPPCTKALIDAGIARVVAGCTDPDPRVSGQGLQALRDVGIEVVSNVCEKDALGINRGFVMRVSKNRPLVTLKTATSADNKIAPEAGQRHWITSPLARARVHLERSLHDAVLVGIGTVLADDPMLNARLPDYDHHTVRVILDSHLRIPIDSQLVRTAKGYPVWVFHAGGHADKAAKLAKVGVRVFDCDTANIPEILNILAREGITRLLVEGGAKVHTSFLEAGMYDSVLWFKAPAVIGKGGVEALSEHNIADMGRKFHLDLQKSLKLGQDLLEIYSRKA